ncbi:hypothetical protein LEMLEM_LOCUS20774, partial [Lemmus lemmus]
MGRNWLKRLQIFLRSPHQTFCSKQQLLSRRSTRQSVLTRLAGLNSQSSCLGLPSTWVKEHVGPAVLPTPEQQ